MEDAQTGIEGRNTQVERSGKENRNQTSRGVWKGFRLKLFEKLFVSVAMIHTMSVVWYLHQHHAAICVCMHGFIYLTVICFCLLANCH